MKIQILTMVTYASLGLVSVAAALVALTCTKIQRQKFPLLRILDGKKLLITVFLVLFAVIAAVSNTMKDVEESREAARLRGQVRSVENRLSASDAELRLKGSLNPVTNSGGQDLKVLFPGGGSWTVLLADGSQQTPLPHLGRNFAVSRSNGNLLVTAEVRSMDGKIVARLLENQWQVNPNNYFSRNYDRSAVEVLDQEGIPCLQVELLNNSTIRLGGVIVCDTGFLISGQRGTLFGPPAREDNLRYGIKKYCVRPWFGPELGKRATFVEPCPETEEEYRVLARQNIQISIDEENGTTNYTDQWIVEVPTRIDGTLRDAIYYANTNTPDAVVTAEALARAKRMLKAHMGVTNAQPTVSLQR